MATLDGNNDRVVDPWICVTFFSPSSWKGNTGESEEAMPNQLHVQSHVRRSRLVLATIMHATTKTNCGMTGLKLHVVKARFFFRLDLCCLHRMLRGFFMLWERFWFDAQPHTFCFGTLVVFNFSHQSLLVSMDFMTLPCSWAWGLGDVFFMACRICLRTFAHGPRGLGRRISLCVCLGVFHLKKAFSNHVIATLFDLVCSSQFLQG